jgi:hypothetical protein
MTKEKYLDLQEDYIEHILEYVKDSGSLFPHISVFADIIKPKKDEINKPALIHIPIADKFMETEDTKDEFIDEILPDVFKSLKKKFIPAGVAWASEAWMRVAGSDFDIDKDDWKAIKTKKEIIIITIESDFGDACFMYEIKRNGAQVNSNGELVSSVELEKLDELSSPDAVGGRFSGLFKKLKD